MCLIARIIAEKPQQNLANSYLSHAKNRNTRRCKTCSKLSIKAPERCHLRRSGVFIINFEHISHLFSKVPIVDFEQVNVCLETASIVLFSLANW